MKNKPATQPSSSKPPASQPGLKIPTDQDLAQSFQNFMRMKTNLPLGQPVIPQSTDALSLEWAVLFLEPKKGILLVRTTEEFERRAQTWDAEASHTLLNLHYLEDLVVAYWHHLASTYWHLKTAQIRSGLLRRSTPETWPQRKPTASYCQVVMDQPIEVRLWVPATEKEMVGP